MKTIFQQMKNRLSAGEALMLVSITAASGAVPRGAGAHMLVGSHGRICGTIGCGEVEHRCELAAVQALKEGKSLQDEFVLRRDDVKDLGMICGGAVSVLFHYMPAGDEEHIALADRALELMAAGRGLWMLSDLQQEGKLSLYTREEGYFGRSWPQWVTESFSSRTGRLQQEGEDLCVQQINSPGRVYIFGGGHVSRELEPVLSHVGFRCVVLEDRAEFADRKYFPTAEDVKLIDFTRIGDYISIGKDDYVCVMTRGHAWDTVVQAQILRCAPCYVGVIGSRSKAAAVRKALAEDYGLTEEELGRITTPIGLSIGAETPEEIAISIAAQMIQHRASLR